MKRHTGISLMLLSATLFAVVLLSAKPRTQAQLVINENSGRTDGVYGPLGEWNPFPPTPETRAEESATPEGTPPPVQLTAEPTLTPPPVITLTRRPMPSLTPLRHGTPPNPYPTSAPPRQDHPPLPTPDPDNAITATLLPLSPPEDTPDPTALAARTAIATLSPSPTTDSPPTPTLIETATIEPLGTQTAAPELPSPEAVDNTPELGQEHNAAGSPEHTNKLPQPNEVARVQAGGQIGDDHSDTITGGGYMPQFINGQMGQWTGAAIANIPIDVPQGPNGQAPRLSLTYSSNAVEDVYFQGGRNTPYEGTLQTAASPYGYGWSLAGIPSISRVGRVTTFGDSNNGGFELQLGGETTRLIGRKLDSSTATPTPTSTTTPQTPSALIKQRLLYQTYPQRFMYIARTTEEYTSKTCGYDPLYVESRWEIITSDGTHYEFGGNDNVKLTPQTDCSPVNPDDYNAVQFMTSGGSGGQPRAVLPAVWYVTKITDPHGNVMRFRYRKESMADPYEQDESDPRWGQYDTAITLAEITYGGTDESQHRLRVVVVPQTHPRRDCMIAINKTGNGTPAPTPGAGQPTAAPTATPLWEHWDCGMQLEQNQPAGYRSEFLIDRIEVQMKHNVYPTGTPAGTPTPTPAWTIVRTYNLGYTFHTRPAATPQSVFSYDRALLERVTLADGDIAQATPVPTALPTGATSTATKRPDTATPAPTARQTLPPYALLYDLDSTRVNWLPLSSIDNGYGGKSAYTYVTTPTPVSCWNSVDNRQNEHRRRPVDSLKSYNNNVLVSSSTYQYEGGECSEKFSTTTEGQLGYWYEFLGFGTVHETFTDHTPTGTPVVSRITTTDYYRCRGNGTPCVEATPTGTVTPGAYTGVEPHPNKGEVQRRQVRPQATTAAVELEEIYTYSDTDLEVDYIGYSTVTKVTSPWGRPTAVVKRRSGRTTLGVGTPSASVASVTTYAYETDRQQGKQWGNITHQTDYLSEADHPSSPYRTGRTIYNAREAINPQDFSVTQSTFIVDRPRIRAIFEDDGALPNDNPTPAATAAVRHIEWYIYDDKTNPIQGLSSAGAVKQHITLEPITAFPASVESSFASACTGTVDRFRTIVDKFTYTTSGGAGNLQDEITYSDYGHACVVNPFTGSDTVHFDGNSPRDSRTTSHAYDEVTRGLLTAITSPQTYVSSGKYYGINSIAPPNTTGYFPGLLHTVTEPNGNDTTFAYDRIGRTSKIVKPGDTLDSPTIAYGYSDALSLSPSYPSVHSVWTKRESDGSPWSDQGAWERTFLDGRGQIIEIQRPHYNWTGNPDPLSPTPAATATGNDVIVHRQYDAMGNLVAESNPATKAAYNTAGSNPYEAPGGGLNWTRTAFDVTGRPLVVTNPDATTIKHHYGVDTTAPRLWIEDIMNEEQHRSQTRTDSLGRLREVREYNGDCGAMGFSCGTPHPTTWESDSSAAKVTYDYDVEDNLERVTEPGGAFTELEYDMFGRKTRITDPDLGTWTYVFDAAGNVGHQVDSKNLTVCHFYDSRDRETQRRYVTAPAATPSPCTVNQGTGTPTPAGTPGPSFAYGSGSNEKGHRTSSTLVDGSWYTWEFDSRGRMKKETQHLSGNGAGTYTTIFTFKSNDDVASIKHPDTLDTLNVTYNIAGVDVVQSGPTAQSPGHPNQYFVSDTQYTADQRVDWRVLGPTAVAVVQDSDFNAVDRRLYRIRAGYTGPHYKDYMDQYYDYNGLGYDDAGNLLDIDDWISGGPQEQTLTYDDRDRLISADATGSGTNYGDYGPEQYRYNRRGNLIYRSAVVAGTSVPITYSYHAGKIHAVRKVYGGPTVTPSGPTPTFTPTPGAGTPTATPTGSTISARVKKTSGCTGFVYDIDMLLMVNDQADEDWFSWIPYAQTDWSEITVGTHVPLTGNDVISIGFNGTAIHGSGCEVLVDWIKIDNTTIQAEGGRMAVDVGGWSGTGGYAESEQQDGISVIAPSEDVSGGTRWIIVDDHGALRFAKGILSGAYEYDANGNMYWRIVESNAYNVIYDGDNRLAEVKKDEAAGATGTIEAAFTYDGDGRRIKSRHGNKYTLYVGDAYEYTENCPSGCSKSDVISYYLAGAERVAAFQGVEWLGRDLYWLLSDHLGSTTRTVYASTRTVRSDSRYKAWGSDRYYSGGSGQLSSRQFTGQHEEASVGLYYYNARYYDPSLGRFISPDSIVPSSTALLDLNRFTYARNNPVRYSDSTGHCIDGLTTVACVVIGIAVLKAVDYGWTAYDIWQDEKIASNENLPVEERQAALDRIALAIAMEAIEPDDATPIGLPLDDLARHGILAGAKHADEAAEAARLANRVDELHDVLDVKAQRKRTSAVLSTDEGVDILAGGARDLDPIQRQLASQPGDVAARLPGAHAEVTALDAAKQRGLTPRHMAVSRPICAACRATIESAGGVVSPNRRSAHWHRE